MFPVKMKENKLYAVIKIGGKEVLYEPSHWIDEESCYASLSVSYLYGTDLQNPICLRNYPLPDDYLIWDGMNLRFLGTILSKHNFRFNSDGIKDLRNRIESTEKVLTVKAYAGESEPLTGLFTLTVEKEDGTTETVTVNP